MIQIQISNFLSLPSSFLIYQKSFYCYECLFYFNKIMLFHFNENLHELCLHLNIMHVCLLFYIVDDLVCRVRFTYRKSNHRFCKESNIPIRNEKII